MLEINLVFQYRDFNHVIRPSKGDADRYTFLIAFVTNRNGVKYFTVNSCKPFRTRSSAGCPATAPCSTERLPGDRTHLFSHEIAAAMRLSDSQVRRDLMTIGTRGVPSHGYEVHGLLQDLDLTLNQTRLHGVAVVGVGSLGRRAHRHPGIQAAPTCASSAPSTRPGQVQPGLLGGQVPPHGRPGDGGGPGGHRPWPSSACPRRRPRPWRSAWSTPGSRACSISPRRPCACPGPSRWKRSTSAITGEASLLHHSSFKGAPEWPS